jgi:hypothetical protein
LTPPCRDYPKIPILTVEDWLAGPERLAAPPQANPFAKAEREVKTGKQEEMLSEVVDRCCRPTDESQVPSGTRGNLHFLVGGSPFISARIT